MSESGELPPPVAAARPTANDYLVTAAKGSGITFIGALIEYAGRFLLGFLLARLMGDEQYGLYSVTDSAVYLMIGLAPLGLGTGLLHFVPIATSRHDDKMLWQTLQISLLLPLLLSLGIGLGFLGLADTLAVNLFHEPRIANLLRLTAIAVPAGTLGSILVAATQSFKVMRYKVIAQDLLLTLSKLVLTGVLALTGLNVVKAMSVYSFSMVLSCLALLYFLNRLLPRERPRRLLWEGSHLRNMFKFSLPVYLAEMLTLFGPNIRTLLLGSLNTMRAAGIFTVAARVNMVGSIFLNGISTISMPIVSELYANHETQKLRQFYQTATKWTFAFNLPFFLIVLLFARPILSLFGTSYVAGATGLLILALSNLIAAATGLCGVVVIMTNNVWLNTFNAALRLIFTVTFSFWLIPTGGVNGAALATAISLIAVNLILTVEVFLLFRLTPYNRTILKPLLAGLVAGGLTYALKQWGFGGQETWGPTLLGLALLGITYGGVLVALGLSPEDRLILDRLYRRVRRALPGRA